MHHDKGTYHVFQQRGKPQDTRLFTSAQLKLSVRLQKVDPAFCRESFPSHPRAPTSFTGHQKLTSWGPQSVGVADRQLGTCFTYWPTACCKALIASRSRAVAACAASGSDMQRAAKPALADSAHGKTTNSAFDACSNRCRFQSRCDSGVRPAPLRQARVWGSCQSQNGASYRSPGHPLFAQARGRALGMGDADA